MLQMVFFGLWFALPIACAIAQHFVGDAWNTQELASLRWMLLTAVVWYIFGFASLWEAALNLKTQLFLVVWAAVASWWLVLFGINLLNSIGDSSPATHVAIELVAQPKGMVRFRVMDGPAAGVTFSCAKSEWGPIGGARHKLELHSGRLGWWWGRLI